VKYAIVQFIVFFCFINLALAQESTPVVSNKPIVGWVEKVQIESSPLVMHAKLDPGISSSSIHAEKIKRFTKEKKSWVRFQLSDRYGRKKSFEREILRVIRLRTASDEVSERYVVELGMCLGSILLRDEVSLADRSSWEQELRIGRQSLAGAVIIDPSVTHTVEPACETKE
jgi:hypothetical protein